MAVTTSYGFVTSGEAFQANTHTPSSQSTPEVLALSNGGFVVAYISAEGIGIPVMLDFRDASGLSIGGAQAATQGVAFASGRPSIAQLANGNVLVTWNEQVNGQHASMARLFTPDGTPLEDERIVALGTDPLYPQVAALPTGGYVRTSEPDGLVYAAEYNAAGESFAVSLVNLQTQESKDSAVAALAGGGFVVTYTDESPANAHIRARVFAPGGAADFLVGAIGNNSQSSVVGLPNGNWAVVYADSGWGEGGTLGNGITLQIFTPAGVNVTPNTFIRVNTPSAADESHPDIAVLADGTMMVTWTRPTLGDDDLCMRLFTQDGVALAGQQILASSSTEETDATVAALANGKFVVAWESSASDGDGGSIRAAIVEKTRFSNGDAADDVIAAVALSDAMHGGLGTDYASYANAPAGLVASMLDPAANTGDAEGDTYTSIEGLIGSQYDDLLVAAGFIVDLHGGEGNDTLAGEAILSRLDGGAGHDTATFKLGLGSYLLFDFGNSVEVSRPFNFDSLTGIEQLQFSDATLQVVDDGDPLFDALHYLSRNTDVFFAGADAHEHYNTFGWREGRDPNGFFDTSGYRAANPDVAGLNPLQHYRQFGWKEGRDPGANFDTTLYLLHNPDVAASGIDPLAHFLRFGSSEGRAAHAAVGPVVGGFDAQYYLFGNPDVAAAGVDARTHFDSLGWQEGRDPNAWFDTQGYLARYADVAAAGINPLEHYMTFGWKEGRDPSTAFDTLGYFAANPDVAAANVNPLEHYLMFGLYEGRQSGNDGMWG